jgi:endo-1,4-beta-xylanase
MKQSQRIAVLILMPALVAFGQGQRETRPAFWLEPDKSEPAGTHYRTFSSTLAGGEVSYLIYLPPSYEPQPASRYPVVYWLHGLNGDQGGGAAFVEQLDAAIRAEKAPAMIAVVVNGMRDSFYCDSKDGKWPIESVIVKELIPHIDKTYRTVTRREMRAVEGYSMGGYGAAHLGFKYPDLFGTVGVMAGALVRPRAEVQSGVFEKMFGGDADYVKANDPFELVRQNADKIRGRTTIRIAVGDQDWLRVRAQALHELLGELKIEHEFEQVPGLGHNATLFYKTLGAAALAYYQKGIPRTPMAANYPNASVPSHTFQRGDVEILSFDTEETYDRLQELYRQSQSTQPPSGEMTPVYYRSKLDGSVQPYSVRLPRGYEKERKYPLVLQLHGTNFKEVLSGARTRSQQGMGGPMWIQPDLPVIYAHPFGSPTSFYVGMGEEDILAVVEDAKQRFSVDPDRVFIMGHSMGGYGSSIVGLHYPDHFGGISVGDAAMWGGLPKVPDWMEPQVAIQSITKLYPNGRNVDMFFKNAGAGIQRKSTEFADGIVAEGGFATTEVFPRMPHSFGMQYPYANFVTEVTGHPIKRRPTVVKFYTNTLRYNAAYWVTIDRLTRHNADARVEAESMDDGVRVTTTNIDALTLRLGDSWTPTGKPITLVVDGREVTKGEVADPVHLSKQSGAWALGEWKAGSVVKRHGVQGPIGDAFNTRFLAVYGESDRELAIAELDAVRNPPGPLDIHGDFPLKPAAKVTPADVEAANLILFGTPGSNAVLKRIAPGLPSGLLQGDTIFIYPNPENPARYVVVWPVKLLSAPDHGVNAGWIMPLNLLPDYVVVKEGRVASGGHFDNAWKTP